MEVEKEKRIDVFYSGKKIGVYVPDLIVNDIVLIELKAKPKLTRDDVKQFWYYLEGSKYRVGYLINFGASNRVQIIRRVYDTARPKTI